MRVHIIGEGAGALALRSRVYTDHDLALVDAPRADVTIDLREDSGDAVPAVDGVFSERSRLLPLAIANLVDVCGSCTVLGAVGEVVDDARLVVHASDDTDGDVATALYRTLLQIARPGGPQPQPRRGWRRVFQGSQR